MTIKFSAILVGMFVGITTYWFVAYNEKSLMGIHIYILMSLEAFLGSFLLSFYFNKQPSQIAFLIYLGLILSITLRIIYDISFWDSTSHNLAPIELFLFTLITLPPGFAGTYLAQFIRRWKRE